MSNLCNITNPSACGFHGACIQIGTEDKCICDHRYNPLTNCTETYFKDLNGADIAISVLLVLFYLVFSALCILDISIDYLGTKKHKFMTIAKWSLLIYQISGLIRNIMYLVEAIIREPNSNIFIGISVSIDAASLCVTFSISVLSWIYLISAAKKLKSDTTKTLSTSEIRNNSKIMYYGAWIEIILCVPLFTISNLLYLFYPDSNGIMYFFYFSGIIATFPPAFVPPYFLIKAYLWLRKLDTNNKQIQSAKYKSIFLLIACSGYWVLVLQTFALISGNIKASGPWIQFIAIDICSRVLVGVLTSMGMHLFVSNYMLQPGSYKTAITSVRSNSSSGSGKHSDKSNISSDRSNITVDIKTSTISEHSIEDE